MTFEVIHGDCLEVMAGMEAGSVDAVVCDPPYGLEFMGKEWDRFHSGGEAWSRKDTNSPDWNGRRVRRQSSAYPRATKKRCRICHKQEFSGSPCQCPEPDWEVVASKPAQLHAFQKFNEEWATEALRVLKPSHYLLAFGGTRTWHRLACALEDAGFEIRDTLMWLYGSGFPKGKACLKPAWEPIILARKPGPMRELGIEECRVSIEGCIDPTRRSYNQPGSGLGRGEVYAGGFSHTYTGSENPHPDSPRHHAEGRWPANLVLDEEAGRELDGAVGVLTTHPGTCRSDYGAGMYGAARREGDVLSVGDSGGPSRFFYNAKSSSRERNAGVSGLFVTLELEVCPCGESTAQVTSLVRAISEWATGQESQGCSTSSCGSPSSGQYLTVTVSTTSTETSKTTVSKTSPVWTTRPISESIAAVLATLPACGISLAESAESLGRSLTTTNERAGSAPGARTVVSETPLRTSASVRLQGNTHPTCKPLALMRWLVRLVARPGDLVLDPFTGSGTTGVACMEEGRDFIGIERESEYVTIARRRIEAAAAQTRLPV